MGWTETLAAKFMDFATIVFILYVHMVLPPIYAYLKMEAARWLER